MKSLLSWKCAVGRRAGAVPCSHDAAPGTQPDTSCSRGVSLQHPPPVGYTPKSAVPRATVLRVILIGFTRNRCPRPHCCGNCKLTPAARRELSGRASKTRSASPTRSVLGSHSLNSFFGTGVRPPSSVFSSYREQFQIPQRSLRGPFTRLRIRG